VTKNSFEATYVNYPFAPLVRLGIQLAAWLTSHRHQDHTGYSNPLGSSA